MRFGLALFILVFLAFPFLTLLYYVGQGELRFHSELLQVFAFTTWQAFLSAVGASIIGGWSALGLLRLHAQGEMKRLRILEFIVLLPNAIPVLVLILASLKVFPQLRGLVGIVWVHALLNAGLIGVGLCRLIVGKMAGMSELAWIEGASRFQFVVRGVLPYLKGDLLLLFLSVFSLCFSSFAVPLILGGTQATTVEVLIYEKLRVEASLAQALGIAVLQMVFLIVMAWGLRHQETKLAPKEGCSPLLGSYFGLSMAFIPALVILLGLVEGLLRILSNPSEVAAVLPSFKESLGGSIYVGLLTGFLTLSVLLMLAYLKPTGSLRKLLVGYVAPSSVLTGFALYIFWPGTGIVSLTKIAFGITLVSVPAFYRLQWDALVSSLSGQVVVAKTLGASEWQIFDRVILPQVWKQGCFLAGLVAFWAWGDFSISTVIAERSLTLAMHVQQLMESYRLEVATGLVWLLLIGGALSFMFFWGLGHVFSEES